jgi:hypothetical protein
MPRQSRYERKIEQAAQATASGSVATAPRRVRGIPADPAPAVRTAPTVAPVTTESHSTAPVLKAPSRPRRATGSAAPTPSPQGKLAGRAGSAPSKSGPTLKSKTVRTVNAHERRKKAKTTRKKLVGKIPVKYKWTRKVAGVALAVGYYGWRGTAVTAKAVKVTGKVAGSTTARVVNGSVQKTKWVPDAAKTKKSIRVFGSSYQCCGAKYPSAEALNQHFLSEHSGEERGTTDPPVGAQVVTAATRKNAGKVLVLLPPAHALAGKPVGRHRRDKTTDPAKRADKLVKAYREKITEIGVKAVADNGPSRNIAQAFTAWGDQRPRKLSELRDIAAGAERALLLAMDAMANYERHLTMPSDAGGLNIDPEVTRMPFNRVKDGLKAASSGMAMHIATFEDAYGDYIRKAKTLAPPAVDLAH